MKRLVGIGRSRTGRLGLVAGIVVAAIGGLSAPAYAHHAIVSGSTVCANNDHVITWSIGNSENNKSMNIDSVTATANGQSYAVTGYTSPVGNGGTTTATSVVPGPVTDTSIVLTVNVSWPADQRTRTTRRRRFRSRARAAASAPPRPYPSTTTEPTTTTTEPTHDDDRAPLRLQHDHDGAGDHDDRAPLRLQHDDDRGDDHHDGADDDHDRGDDDHDRGHDDDHDEPTTTSTQALGTTTIVTTTTLGHQGSTVPTTQPPTTQAPTTTQAPPAGRASLHR